MIDYLKAHLRKELFVVLLYQLERYGEVDIDACMDECICMACRWLHLNVEGCSELDPLTPPEELVRSIAVVNGLDHEAVCQTGSDEWRVALPKTAWKIFRTHPVEGPGKIKLKLDSLSTSTFALPAMTPRNRTPDVLRYVDACIPEFHTLIKEQTIEARKQVLEWRIRHIIAEAHRA